MKRKFLIIIYLVFAVQIAKSQNIGINGTGANPDGSAMLDISATNKGLLVPRVALTATNAAGPITSPLTSLFVYNTATAGTAPNNVIPGYYYWNGAAWVAFNTSTNTPTGWSITGNTGTNIATNFLGTTDANDLLFKTNNLERMRVTSTGRVTVGLTYPLPGPSTITSPFAVKDTLEIRRTGPAATNIAQLLFTNTSGTGNGDLRISGDGGDLFWQGGGGRALQMGSYWTTVISGDRSLTTPPAFINGGSAPSVTNRSVLIASSRDISVPLSVQGNSISQSANLQEWLNSGGIAVSVIDNKGNMGIGSGNFNVTNQEKFLVDAGVTNSPYAITAKGSIDNFFQFNIQNQSSGINASTDIVATANNGTDLVNFVDLGINSSGYSVSGALGKSNDGYLISAGNDFYLANTTLAKDIILTTGGSASANERMRITGAGNVGIGTVGTSPTSTLQVKGSISLSTLISSGNYTLLPTDHIVINTGNPPATYTLPAANAVGVAGRIYRIINHGNTSITLSLPVTTGNGITTTNVPITVGSNNFEIISDGTVWRKIN